MTALKIFLKQDKVEPKLQTESVQNLRSIEGIVQCFMMGDKQGIGMNQNRIKNSIKKYG
jgi:hypothetical protein